MGQETARWPRPAAFGIVIFLAVVSSVLYRWLGQWGMNAPPSPAILAMVIGVVVGNVITPPSWLRAGCQVVIKKWIPFAIVGIAAGLNLTDLADPRIGVMGVGITLVCMVVAFGSAILAGRVLGLQNKTAILLGAGTAVCGNSAIAAVAPVIDADDDDLALSMGAVNLFGLVVTLVLPPLALMFQMDDYAAGVWAGTSVHAIPQAIAAGAAVSDAAGEFASLFKMVRVAMLAPMAMIVSIVVARHQAKNSETPAARRHLLSLIPWFVWAFVLASVFNTLGWLDAHIPRLPLLIPAESGDTVPLWFTLKTIGKLILTIAMAAIGMEIRVRSMVRVGGRVVVAGLIASVALLAVSYGLIVLLLKPVGL